MSEGAADEVLEGRIHDRDFMLWVKGQPCAAGDLEDGAERARCEGVIEAHHAGLRHGMSTKADDRTCVPLCRRHHVEWHGATGPFKPWDREVRRAWAVKTIARTQARHARRDSGGGIPW